MRPGDAIFLGQERLPTWGITLVRELTNGGKEVSPHVLTPLAALDELIVTAESVIGGRGQLHERDRRSLAQDVSASLKHLGPGSTAAVGAILRAFQSNDLKSLEHLIEDVDGARRLRGSAKVLRAELLLPGASCGAWGDVVEAFSEGASSETCTLRIAQLRELSVRRGHSWDGVKRRLEGVLADRLIDVVLTGEIETDNNDSFDLNAEAGPSLEKRLELCRAIAGDAPIEGQAIVWMVYGEANLRVPFVRHGPVQFFNGNLEFTDIRDGCPALKRDDLERPTELEHESTHLFFDKLPDQPFVYARVVLDSRHVADVTRFARDVASGLVEIAQRDTGWLLFEGEAVFSDGHWWGSFGFTDPRVWLNQEDPRFDRTGINLEGLAPGTADRLAAGDERTTAALKQRRWERAVAAAEDPGQRLALAMRTLEEALPIPRAAGGVRESCERYLMEAWSTEVVGRQLWDAAYYGTSSGFDNRRERMELRDAIVPGDGESITFHPKVFMERIDEVLSWLEELTMQHRMVLEASSWVSSGAEMAKHIDELDAQFQRLLARTIRQRNAVVHGADTVPEVIATCERFITDLCGDVVAQALRAASDSEDLVDRLESARAAWLRQRAALRNGKQPSSVLFAGPLTE
jgi:hypothetical protein